MPTHEEFRQAIDQDPDNDTPRLVYADWLDEQGNPRGEFIRIQHELKKRTTTPSWKRTNDGSSTATINNLKNQELELESRYGVTWKQEDGIPRMEWLGQDLQIFFENGFAESLAIQLEYPEKPSRPFRLDSFKSPDIYGNLKKISCTRRILRLEFNKRISTLGSKPDLIMVLNYKAIFAGIHEIRLSDWGFTNGHLLNICQTRLFQSVYNIKYLSLNGNNISDEGVNYLINTPLFQNLTTLNLCNNSLTSAGLSNILSSKKTWKYLGLNGQAEDQKSISQIAAQILNIKARKFSAIREELFNRGIYI